MAVNISIRIATWVVIERLHWF